MVRSRMVNHPTVVLSRSWRWTRCLGPLMLRRGCPAAVSTRSGHCRSAKNRANEYRDNCLFDDLVHITPTFLGFLPLHEVRQMTTRFLTNKFFVGTSPQIFQNQNFPLILRRF